MSSINVLRLFLSSPGDVADARQSVQDIVQELNNTWAVHQNIMLQVLDWKTNVIPWHGERPQEEILKQLNPEMWDVFLGIVWARFGTPTGALDPSTGKPYLSGTEEEFRTAYRYQRNTGKPRMLLYRCVAPVAPDTLDCDQLKLVQEFFKQFEYGGSLFGLYSKYTSVAHLSGLVRQHLNQLLQEEWSSR